MYTGKSGTQMSENQESGLDQYFGNTNTHKPMNVIAEYPIHEKKDTRYIMIFATAIYTVTCIAIEHSNIKHTCALVPFILQHICMQAIPET